MARENKQKRHERRFGKAQLLADLIPFGSGGWSGVPIEATNVYSFYREFMHRNTTLDMASDVPCARLPFPTVFVEMERPDMAGGIRVGWNLFAIGADNDLAQNSWRANEGRDDYSRQWTDAVSGILFISYANEPKRSLGICVCHLDELGRLACNPAYDGTEDFRSKFGSDWFLFMQETFVPVLLALSFMHCKNVVLQSIDPDRAINRERKKAGLRPFVRYHTINIEPMKKVLRTEGNMETEGLKKALHICRGHFSRYSEEKPLFGKVAGTFWIPMHVRGSAKEGVIISDYNVKAPQSNG